MRDGADEELIVVALLHDVGESLGPMNHGEIAASILRPFISSDNYNLLKYHGLFQTYFYARHLVSIPCARLVQARVMVSAHGGFLREV